LRDFQGGTGRFDVMWPAPDDGDRPARDIRRDGTSPLRLFTVHFEDTHGNWVKSGE
jgi:hypothetical protein